MSRSAVTHKESEQKEDDDEGAPTCEALAEVNHLLAELELFVCHEVHTAAEADDESDDVHDA